MDEENVEGGSLPLDGGEIEGAACSDVDDWDIQDVEDLRYMLRFPELYTWDIVAAQLGRGKSASQVQAKWMELAGKGYGDREGKTMKDGSLCEGVIN